MNDSVKPSTMTALWFENNVIDRYELPEHLTVEGSVDLSKVPTPIKLPNNLKILGNLNLEDCKGITELPDNLYIDKSCFIDGCTNLTNIPKNMSVGLSLYFSENIHPKSFSFVRASRYHGDEIFYSTPENMLRIKKDLPDSVILQMDGRKIEEIFDHWFLDVTGIRGLAIESAEKTREGIEIYLELE
jgi:hypothetical protein